MTTTSRPGIHKHRARINSAGAMVAAYEALLAVAIDYKVEAEIDRLRREIGEWEAELDEAIEAAIGYGMTPEDMER